MDLEQADSELERVASDQPICVDESHISARGSCGEPKVPASQTTTTTKTSSSSSSSSFESCKSAAEESEAELSGCQRSQQDVGRDIKMPNNEGGTCDNCRDSSKPASPQPVCRYQFARQVQGEHFQEGQNRRERLELSREWRRDDTQAELLVGPQTNKPSCPSELQLAKRAKVAHQDQQLQQHQHQQNQDQPQQQQHNDNHQLSRMARLCADYVTPPSHLPQHRPHQRHQHQHQPNHQLQLNLGRLVLESPLTRPTSSGQDQNNETQTVDPSDINLGSGINCSSGNSNNNNLLNIRLGSAASYAASSAPSTTSRSSSANSGWSLSPSPILATITQTQAEQQQRQFERATTTTTTGSQSRNTHRASWPQLANGNDDQVDQIEGGEMEADQLFQVSRRESDTGLTSNYVLKSNQQDEDDRIHSGAALFHLSQRQNQNQNQNQNKNNSNIPMSASQIMTDQNRPQIGENKIHSFSGWNSATTQHQTPKSWPANHPLGNTKHLCSICGDRATGKHYGVFSCEGCKGFFKRTIRKDIVYACRGAGNCPIDMQQRNRCQHCRYQKCLRQGMKREAVQEEKQRLKMRAAAAAAAEAAANPVSGAPIHTQMGLTQITSPISGHQQSSSSCWQPISRQLDTSAYQLPADHDQSHQPMNIDSGPEVQVELTCQSPNSIRLNSGIISNSYNYQQYSSSHQLTEPTTTTSNSNSPNWIHHQQQQHQNPTGSDHQHLHPTGSSPFRTTAPVSSEPRRLDDVTLRWAAQVQVEQLLDWAKSVARFRDVLIDDQVTLLRTYWNELIVLDIAFRSANSNSTTRMDQRDRQPPTSSSSSGGLLCIAHGLFLGRQQAFEVGLGAMFERIQLDLVDKLTAMQVDSNEIACLRAIVLFNPETQGLKSARPIEDYRGQVYTTLELYCRKHRPDQPNRFGKLLLLLPALRSIGLRCHQPPGWPKQTSDNLSTSTTTGAHQQSGRSFVLSPGASSPTGSTTSSTSSSSSPAVTSSSPYSASLSGSPPTGSVGIMQPNSVHHVGNQGKLLFFDECYQASSIDSFLRFQPENLTETRIEGIQYPHHVHVQRSWDHGIGSTDRS